MPGHGRDIVIRGQGKQKFQLPAPYSGFGIALSLFRHSRRAFFADPGELGTESLIIPGGESGYGVLEGRAHVPVQNLLRAGFEQVHEKAGLFRDQVAAHVAFKNFQGALVLPGRMAELDGRNRLFLSDEPVRHTAVYGFPPFFRKVLEPLPQVLPEQAVQGIGSVGLIKGDERIFFPQVR